jgi:hypothetical protein
VKNATSTKTVEVLWTVFESTDLPETAADLHPRNPHLSSGKLASSIPPLCLTILPNGLEERLIQSFKQSMKAI